LIRTFSAVIAATALIAGSAHAQLKKPVQQPPSASASSSPVVITSNEPPIESAKRIERDDAIKMVKDKKAVWVDVRPVSDYNAAHIPGSLSIPLAELPQRLADFPKNKYIITYCA
jgi:hypothetical protein